MRFITTSTLLLKKMLKDLYFKNKKTDPRQKPCNESDKQMSKNVKVH